MPKSLSIRSGLGSILFWSVISAAFIGPGSVTACAIAGSKFGLQLLWVLTFATLGTVWLQEAAARITIATGHDLGQVIRQTYTGTWGRWIAWALFTAVFLGCAAYQAGNILGAVSGLSLLTAGAAPNLSVPALTVGIGLVCILLLWLGSTQNLANFLGVIVFAMGGAFVYVAFSTPVTSAELTKALVVPSIPAGSLLLINSLIGTTIVPYNLFFGSSIVSGQSLSEMRLGIWVAVGLGGIISVVLLLAGLLIPGDFSYPHIAQVLADRIGPWAGSLFAFGLFAAGFASSLTAPLAAAVTAQSLLGVRKNSPAYRAIWLIVMATGLAFGLRNVTPIPVIVAVQAINGILLPFVTVFLFAAVNNRALLGDTYRNSLGQNVAMGIVVIVTAVLGLWNVWLAFQ